MKSFMEELLPNEVVELELYSDSSAGLSSQNRLGLGKIKHVHLKHMFVQGLIREGRLVSYKVDGYSNSSDLGTKYLERTDFERHRAATGLSMPGGEVQEIKEENFDASVGNPGMQEMRKGVVLCLGGLLAMLRGAKAHEGVCGEGECQMQVMEKKESRMDAMAVTLCALFACVLIGMALGWKLRVCYDYMMKEKRESRNARTQSQTRYAWDRSEPRFIPLAEMMHGCWIE